MITEAQLQKSIVDYLRAVAPECLTFAVPNSSVRTRTGRASNAVAGLTAGIPDIAVVAPGGKLHFIEVKRRAGKLSPVQEEMRFRCIRSAIPWILAYSVEDVREALIYWRISSREAA